MFVTLLLLACCPDEHRAVPMQNRSAIFRCEVVDDVRSLGCKWEKLLLSVFMQIFFVDARNELCTSCAATHKVDLLLLHRARARARSLTTMIKSSAWRLKTKANLGHYRQCHFVHWTKWVDTVNWCAVVFQKLSNYWSNAFGRGNALEILAPICTL